MRCLADRVSATLVFDSQSVKHVQPGRTTESIDRKPVAGTQWLYALGAVNLSGRRMEQCRVVLEASEPRHTSQQRLERPLRVRGLHSIDGHFDLNFLDGSTSTAFIEVLEEWVPPVESGEQSRLRMTHASTDPAKAFEFDRLPHVLCFRLETDEASSRCFLSAQYVPEKNRWQIAVTKSIEIGSNVADARSRARI